MNVYIATPIEPSHHKKEDVLNYAERIANFLELSGHTVHKPWKVHIPNAWDLPNSVWGNEVFKKDLEAIDKCDILLAIAYDRDESTPGTCWEIGYAYAKKKKVFVVEHESTKVMSIMLANGNNSVVHGYNEFFKKFNSFANNNKTYKTSTEVK